MDINFFNGFDKYHSFETNFWLERLYHIPKKKTSIFYKNKGGYLQFREKSCIIIKNIPEERTERIFSMYYPYYKIQDAFTPLMTAPDFRGSGAKNECIDSIMRRISAGLFEKIDFSITVDMFRNTLDYFAAGEFWGKLMRAACIFYECTRSDALKAVIEASMKDMLSVQAVDGEISCTPRSAQPNGTHGSDLWERKYVLLGMFAYYRVFHDEAVLSAMCRLADYTCTQVGSREEGKTPITDTGWAFCGIESSSILEPIVKLYGLTGREEYLRLARHIVEETGACSRENIFEAIAAGKPPYLIGSNGNPKESIAKAYEMMSCFEGLCEYYRATGEERWKNIALQFFDRLVEEEITLLGSGGADQPYNLGPGTGEQWNRTKYEQTNPAIVLAGETCVTITWMKLCVQLLALTGDKRCADQIEISLENSLRGALRSDGAYFDYFPAFGGTRGGKVNFTYDIGDMPLSCCTANGPAGIAALRDCAVMQSGDSTACMLYLYGVYRTGRLTLAVSADVSKTAAETVHIRITESDGTEQLLCMRIPAWTKNAGLSVNGEALQMEVKDGYAHLLRTFAVGDEIVLSFPRQLEVIKAPHGSDRAGDGFFALRFGAHLMARDKRFDAHFTDAQTCPWNTVPDAAIREADGVTVALETVLDGVPVTLVDYASAGGTWNGDSEYRSWIPIKG